MFDNLIVETIDFGSYRATTNVVKMITPKDIMNGIVTDILLICSAPLQ